MTAVATIDSREARTQWRTLMDGAGAGETDFVITRYNKPIATLINYDDWLALQDELEDLRVGRRADAVYQAWKRDPSTARPWTEIRAELVAAGVLDADEAPAAAVLNAAD